MSTWHDTDSARDEWSPQIPDTRLASLLEIAREVVEEYARPSDLPEGYTDVPERLRLAQIMYARETLNAAMVNPQGQYDEGSFAASPFPLSWKVKGLIRPQRAVPAVG